MRDLATLPRGIQEPLLVRDGDRRPPRGRPGSALLLCVVGSALLGDLLGVSRSMEREGGKHCAMFISVEAG